MKGHDEECTQMVALVSGVWIENDDDDDSADIPKREAVPPVASRSRLAVVILTAFASGILVQQFNFLAAGGWEFPRKNKSSGEQGDVMGRIRNTNESTTSVEEPPVAKSQSGGAGETEDDSWSATSSLLCPGGIPQHEEYGGTLFELARDELGMVGLPAEERDAVPNLGQYGVDDNFFHFVGESIGYAAPEQQGRGMIYLGIWKAAHDQINNYFLHNFNGDVEESKSVPELLRSIQRKQGRNTPLSDVCVVTAIRDPVSHFLSGYNEIEFKNAKEKFALKEEVLYDHYQNGTTERFKQFVANFVGHPTRTISPAIQHVYSMSGVLSVVEKLGLRLTSYLPSVHNLTNTWPAFLFNACPSLPQSEGSQKMSFAGQHSSSIDTHGFRRAGETVWAQGGPTARALCAIHAMDYACWEQLPGGIPKLCKDVFASTNFASKLIKKKELLA